MQAFLIDLLQCPACGGALSWQIRECDGEHIETAKARCQECNASYPVREGIGIFLSPDLPRQDLWEESQSQLARYLCEHPEREHQLLGAPLENLSPA
ncbi:MAG: hypothetical protein J7M05_11730, partial [Anaerolineae bacterium]|nr:hypothetical protein [Anaerolineae bacterium]